jgi:hypothetical protein
VKRLRFLPVPIVAAVLGLSSSASANHDPAHIFSGTWKTNLGEVSYRVTDSASGKQALQAMNGQPCNEPTVYYLGDYSDANGQGKMTACTHSAGHLVGRYRSNKNLQFPGGSFDVTFAAPGTFTGFYTADDPSFPGQFPYTGTLEKHFSGDGSTAAKGDATLSGIRGKVEVQLNQGGWQPATSAVRLKPGDRVHTGWKGSVVLSVRGEKIVVAPMTLVVIQGEGNEATGILKFGEIKVEPETLDDLLRRIHYPIFPLSKIIFRHGYRLPAARVSGRASAVPLFTVLYDAAAGAAVVSVARGSLTLDPDGPGLPTVTVTAGHEVEITRTTVSTVAPIGKAGAPPGSVSRLKAREVVLAAAAPGSVRCGAAATGVTLTKLALGWTVALRFTGRVGGSATWTIRGTRVAPANPLAAKIAAGCPGSAGSSAKPGHYSGTTSEGKPVSFNVAAYGRSVSKVTAGAFVDCVGGSKGAWTLSFSGSTALSSTLRFSRSYTGALSTGGSTTNVKVSDSISGQLDSAGGATGTFTLSHISWDQAGKHYDCTGKAVSWTARR